jgi:NAD-dependent SIR2 family protein deacetylase
MLFEVFLFTDIMAFYGINGTYVEQPLTKKHDRLFEHAAELIDTAEALIIAVGAGMGVDSGLPDFRGNDGFWKAYPALGKANIEFYSIACPDAFRRTPRLAWGFYAHRLNLYRRVVPHDGFAMLRGWGESMLHGYSVFTSNVDGQFQKAGFDPRETREYHGSIHHLQCLAPCSRDVWSANDFIPEVDAQTCELVSDLPKCPKCGGLARPNILMFGDREWSDQRAVAQDYRQEAWLREVSNPAVIEIGAGTAIPSVRHFSQRMICEVDARLVRINPTDAQVPRDVDVGLAMGGLAGLRGIQAAMAND